MRNSMFSRILSRAASVIFFVISLGSISLTEKNGIVVFPEANASAFNVDSEIPSAKSGDSVAIKQLAYHFHSEAITSKKFVPDAIFWLSYHNALSSGEASSALKEYVRKGYRSYVHRVEALIKEEFRTQLQAGDTVQFPSDSYSDSLQYGKSILGSAVGEELITAELSTVKKSDEADVCRQAISVNNNEWDTDLYATPYVDEAAFRKYTVDFCRDVLTKAAFKSH